MSKLEKIDKVIGEALEHIMVAASTIRECDELENNLNLRFIGEATVKLWDVRNNIYAMDSGLKPDFVAELEKNKDAYDEQDELHKAAAKKEAEGNAQAAHDFYQQLLDCSTLRHFKTLAEAGLYRVGKER